MRCRRIGWRRKIMVEEERLKPLAGGRVVAPRKHWS
jgi:hypothetical protein